MLLNTIAEKHPNSFVLLLPKTGDEQNRVRDWQVLNTSRHYDEILKVEIINKLCEMKQIELFDGSVCVDHIHMYVAIPPKISVSEFMSYLKGKSTLMLFDRHPEYRQKWGDRHFWARGYYVSTVGNVNEDTIRKYIQEQEENDKLEDGRR